ncbi:MAG: acyl--CoA ligase [Myxococcales bacterium]|nr:acyl--CoA ligase [Myxococcales bacterium]
MKTIPSLLAAGATGAPAIAAPGRKPTSYAALRALAARTVEDLNAMGIGRGDRVAIVLNNGPEMAAAFMSIASACATAPLNPGYRHDEFEFYLGDLQPKALVIDAGCPSPSREVAASLSIPIVELRGEKTAVAGTFRLETSLRGKAASPGPAQPDDDALLLHTSGTTSRPKLVPLLQRNLTASAANISRVLALTPDDTCLNIMPLFHIHGLVAGVLSSVAAGAQTCCSPGFNALRFFHWFDEVRPTWWTGVPAMHRAILERSARHPESLKQHRLRLIRSSSASLRPALMASIEKTFNVPVIESYGMTEAAHQMASNPLPPSPRKPGSVGRAAGPEIAIMGEGGRLLPAGDSGEIVIRGPNVFEGYASNPDANAAAFTNGWFRTGDQGLFDEEGYLRINGRLKEMINRGGEKVAPIEVDTVLLEHPAVQLALTFALPHESLGEQVAAAIVVREGKTVTERELREFASKRLAHYKVPHKFVFVKELPRGPTGKLQRIGLAQKLGLAS